MNSIKNLILKNSYPGRGIVIGKSKDGCNAVTAYFIMGRSENSRNRVFSAHENEVTIYPHDETKVKDPSLIIYSPVKAYKNNLIVTNGDQTDTIYEYLIKGGSFEQALSTRCFEPDAPNFTPRISGILSFRYRKFTYKLNILKSAAANSNACYRFNFSYEPINGVGHFIHTYKCDGDPLPSFTGEPEIIDIPDDINEFTSEIWDNLNNENKISLFVRYINIKTGESKTKIINKNK